MNSKYPGATVTVARGNPQSLALNDSPSNHLGPVVQMLDSAIQRLNNRGLVEILEHKHLTMKFDIVGIHCRTSFKNISKSAGFLSYHPTGQPILSEAS